MSDLAEPRKGSTSFSVNLLRSLRERSQAHLSTTRGKLIRQRCCPTLVAQTLGRQWRARYYIGSRRVCSLKSIKRQLSFTRNFPLVLILSNSIVDISTPHMLSIFC